MKVKKNHLLTMAVLSLLGVNQNVMAGACDAPAVCSTMTLNGVTREVAFSSQAQLQSISDGSASLPDQVAFGALFTNPTTGKPAGNSAGLVSTSNVNGVPVTLMNAGSGTFVVAQPDASGNVQYTTVNSVVSGGKTTVKASQVAAEYIKSVTTPGYTVDPNNPASAALATNVKQGVTAAIETAITPLVSAVGNATSAPVALPPAGIALSATSITTVTDPATVLAAQVALQLVKSQLAQAQTNAGTGSTIPLPVLTVMPGSLQTVTTSPAVQLQTAQTTLAATKTVAATALTSTDPLTKAAAAQLQLAAANAVVTATQAAVTAGVSGVSAADVTAAQAAVTTATQLVAANPAFGQAALDAQTAIGIAQTTAATATSNLMSAANAGQQAAIARLQANQYASAAARQADLTLIQPLASYVTAEIKAQNDLIAKQQAFVTALQKDPNAAQLSSVITQAQNDLKAMGDMLTLEKYLVPLDAVAIASTASAETSKVVSAIGTAAATDILAKEKALNDAAASYDLKKTQDAAQALATQLAMVKTNQFQAANNSTSGIAGNPASTMNMTIDGMFNQSADFGGTNAASTSNVSGASADIGGVNTSVGVGLQYGYYSIGNKSINTVTMPLSVTAKFNPKHQLTVSVPLSYIQTQGQSDAYQVGVNAAYKYNVTDNWSLTPAVAYSYRSFDNSQNQYWNPNTSTSLVGGSITSKYTWNFSPMAVSLINMIGHFQSLDSNNNTTSTLNFGTTNNMLGINGVVNGTAANNTIANYVVKNGLHATKMYGNFKVGAYFTDTEYFGSALYLHQFNEFGFSLKPVNAGKMLDALSVDANYLFSIAGKNSGQLDGFRLNVGYKF